MSTVLSNSKRLSAGIEGVQCPWELLLELSNSILGFPFDLLFSSANVSWQASALVDNCFFLAQSRFPFLAREKLAVQLIDFKFGLNSCDVYDRFVRQLFSNRKLNDIYIQKFLSEVGFLQFQVSEPRETQVKETVAKEESSKSTKKDAVIDTSLIKQEIIPSVECVRVSDGAFFEDDDYCFIQEFEVDCDPFSEIPEQLDAAKKHAPSSFELPADQTSSSSSQWNEGCCSSFASRDQSPTSDTSPTVQSKELQPTTRDCSPSEETTSKQSRIQSDNLSNISESSIRSVTSIKQECFDKEDEKLKNCKRRRSNGDLKVEGDKIRGNEARSPKDKSKIKTIKVENLEDDYKYKDLQYGKYAKKPSRCPKDKSLDRTDEKSKKCDIKVDVKKENDESQVDENGSEAKKSSDTKDAKKKLSFKILNNCRDPRLTKRRKLEGFDT